MRAADALKQLGVSRVIWIDDVFGTKPPDLAELLFNSPKVAAECNFPELRESIGKSEFSGEELKEEIAEVLAGLPPERTEEIRSEFFAKETIREKFATSEVSREEIDGVCSALRIDEKDRWTFGQADIEIAAIVKDGDSSVAFIIDLNEAGGGEARGFEVLKALHTSNSQSTAFILTHAATAETEAAKEHELRASIVGEGGNTLLMPVCVIAKKRIEDATSNEQLENELLVSIKRASLRKSMSQVISAAEPVVTEAFRETAAGLLSIPPEQLEEFVYERGYREGVSELHVVERILTSQIAQKLQRLFGTDTNALESASRLRRLRGIRIGGPSAAPDPQLARYRLDEVWESAELINGSYSPISCGDVFAVDRHEKDVKGISAMFVVLAQPCDIALRPKERLRTRETAVFVPLVKLKPKDAIDGPGVLPCDLQDAKWRCDFDKATLVSVPILDLASFRKDGRVRFDEAQDMPADLLPSHERAYKVRVGNPSKVIAGKIHVDGQGCAMHPSLQLTFGFENEFSHFYVGRLKDPKAAHPVAKIPALPKRVTWRLQRVGHIRPPHSISFLEEYLREMGRRAFDIDFMSAPDSAESAVTALEPVIAKKDPAVVAWPADASEAEATDEPTASESASPQKREP